MIVHPVANMLLISFSRLRKKNRQRDANERMIRQRSNHHNGGSNGAANGTAEGHVSRVSFFHVFCGNLKAAETSGVLYYV